MSHNQIRTRVPSHLKGMPSIPHFNSRIYSSEHISPKTLIELSSRKCDSLPHPCCWSWSIDEVQLWVTLMGYPQLREKLTQNLINGKTLLWLEADQWPKMNLKDFRVIKNITSALREMLKIDADEFSRSMSLPLRRPVTLYLWSAAMKDDGRPQSWNDFLRSVNIIRSELRATNDQELSALSNHWKRIPPDRPRYPHVRVGNIPRINPMTGKKQTPNFYLENPRGCLHKLCYYSIADEKLLSFR